MFKIHFFISQSDPYKNGQPKEFEKPLPDLDDPMFSDEPEGSMVTVSDLKASDEVNPEANSSSNFEDALEGTSAATADKDK